MSKVVLMKVTGGYMLPVTQQDVEALAKIKEGDGIECSFTKKRQLWYHKKFFALLNYAYDVWEPPEVKWQIREADEPVTAVKNFERYRKDIIIKAGYYEIVVNLKGEARAEAQSISFDNMDEDAFSMLFGKVLGVIIDLVLRNYTDDDIDRVIENLEAFNP